MMLGLDRLARVGIARKLLEVGGRFVVVACNDLEGVQMMNCIY
jgi:hypothetical protein